MQQHHINVNRSARYFTLGSLDIQTTDIWFVLHGYGQLAEYFIKKFEVLHTSATFVVAPEGLSRFYLSENGRVGASWMTREDRLHEITDQMAYLHQIYDTVLATIDVSTIRIHIFGFSQGTHTACRWVSEGKIKFDRLLLYAGPFTVNLSELLDFSIVKNKVVKITYGTHDRYLKEINPANYEQELLLHIPNAEITSFEGGHSVLPNILKKL